MTAPSQGRLGNVVFRAGGDLTPKEGRMDMGLLAYLPPWQLCWLSCLPAPPGPRPPGTLTWLAACCHAHCIHFPVSMAPCPSTASSSHSPPTPNPQSACPPHPLFLQAVSTPSCSTLCGLGLPPSKPGPPNTVPTRCLHGSLHQLVHLSHALPHCSLFCCCSFAPLAPSPAPAHQPTSLLSWLPTATATTPPSTRPPPPWQ